MEAFYDENDGKDGVREWHLGRGAPRGWGFWKPPEDRGFKYHTFTADKRPQLYQGGAYRGRTPTHFQRAKELAFKRGWGGQLCVLVVGGSSYRACAAPWRQEPTAFAHQLQSVHPSHPRVVVTISGNDWSAKILFWAHPCFARALLLRRAALSWCRGWGAWICLFSSYSLLLLSSPFQHRRGERTKDAACAGPIT